MNPQLAALKTRFSADRVLNKENQRFTLESGIQWLNLPRGAITEVVGPPSSGRSTLLCSTLAAATHRQEVCALVDTGDTFDPASAAAAGVDLRFLLWVRCINNKKCALQVVDWLVQGGGFGLVALDLAHLTSHDIRNIPMHTWFRFRHAVENKPTTLLVIAAEHCTGSTAAMQLEMSIQRPLWRGELLRGAVVEACPRKPARPVTHFEAQSCLLA